MGGWYYSAVKVKAEFGDGYEYTVGEVYPGLEGTDGKIPYTENAKFYGETPKDLVEWLREAADDIEKYGVVNDDEV